MKTKLRNLFIIILFPLWSFGQSCGAMMIPLSIEDRVSESSIIVEGVITDSQSYWDTNRHNIYTVHTVSIYKNIKANKSTSIKVVTMGGQLEDRMQTVSDAAVLKKGDVGLFFLQSFRGSIAGSESLYELVGAAQGVITYSRFGNNAADVFSKYSSVEAEIYNKVKAVTKTNFQEVRKRPIRNSYAKGVLATPVISSFSPTTATAGTQTVLTITGSNFGATEGTVSFPNANAGGLSLSAALSSQIVSWSDTEIQVEIPWFSGTGAIQVTNSTAESATSSSNVTITYAHVNASASNSTETFDFPTTIPDLDGNGGITFEYHTEFDSSSAKTVFEDAFGLWNCESDINFTFGGTTTTDATADDGVNIVRFDNGDELPSTTLGRVSTYYTGVCGSNAVIKEMDITWNDGTNWYYGSGIPGSSQYDFKSVALHELGHTHRLGHVINSNDVMHYTIGRGTNSYALNQNNIDGAVYTMGLFRTNTGCGVTPAMSPQYNCCDTLVITTQPVDDGTAENENASFTADADNYTSVQWQESTNGGTDWSNLTDSAPYSGTTTTTLTLTGVPGVLDGDMYRAVFSNECGETATSDAATLTIIAYTAIPDANFEAALSAYDDEAGDGRVPTALIEVVTSLNVAGQDISDLTGIKDFTSLENLEISGNSIVDLDLSNMTNLKILQAIAAITTSLNVSNATGLETLSAHESNLSSINLSGATAIKELNVYRTYISSLDLTELTLLEKLQAFEMPSLRTVDLTGLTALKELQLWRNSVETLNLTTNIALEVFVAYETSLRSLNLRNGTNSLITTFNAIDNLDLTCILVDSVTHSTNNWTNIDDQASFSETACPTTYALAIKAYLQGAALNPNTGEESLMRDDLRVADLLPTESPYQDREETTPFSFFTTGANAIVDWVWVELRDQNDPAVVIASQSALLQRDGDIVAVDGISDIEFTVVESDYYILLTHRNHLSIRSANTVALSTTTANLDLTTDTALIEGGTNAMVDLGNGIYAMLAGDQDANGQVQNTDINTVITLLGGSGYSDADMDMNGQVQNTDINNLMNPNVGKGEQF